MTGGFRAPRGTVDVLPPDSALFVAVREALAEPARRAGYGYVDTPLFEDTALFERGVGDSTDVVTHQMYTFTDRGGRSLTLRPEGTAGVLRAVLEHGLDRGRRPVKLYYAGPYFRYESPQAGRQRQFTQVGVEAIGSTDPALDAEVVVLGVQGYRALGLRAVTVELNSLGDAACRPAYRAALQAFLAGLDLDADTRDRAARNPLRVLDDKRPEVRAQLAGVPVMANFLCPDCRAYHDAVRSHLADLGVEWVDAPRLVRGLDYYTRTTFEYTHPGLGAQSSVGGGGRYDGLAEALGGAALPGIGFGLGVERTMIAVGAEGVEVATPARCEVFAVPLGSAARRLAFQLVHRLREAGISADEVFGEGGLKGAMKAADRSGARFAVVLGERDLAGDVVQLKDLASGAQHAVPVAAPTFENEVAAALGRAPATGGAP